MMSQVVSIARDALRTVRTNKRWWVLGFFVAASSGSGGGEWRADPEAATGTLEPWMIAAMLVALLLGAIFFAVQLVAEGALVEAVREERRGQQETLRASWSRGPRHALRLAGLQLVTLGAVSLTLLIAAAPAIGAAVGLLPWAVGIGLSVPLGLIAVPTVISLSVAREVGTRMVVLESRGPVDALRAGLRFLRGRLPLALMLLIADGLAQAAVMSVGLLLVAPGVAVAAALYFGLGLVGPAIAVGLVLAVPPVIAAVGARGTFHSALWTHAFLDERPALS